MKKYLLSLSGLIFPGLGHVLMGRFAKGLVFMAVLGGMFFAGITLDTDYYHRFGISVMGEKMPPIEDRGGAGEEGTVDRVWKYLFTYVYPFVVGLGAYVSGFALREFLRPLVVSFGLASDLSSVPVMVKDIGYCFALLSGLLNILVMMDAFDLAYNAEVFDDPSRGRKEKWLQ